MNKCIPVFLDTDIGPDCDDAGALAILLYLHRTGACRITGITHTTGSRYGLGCIDAICRRFALNFPTGTCPDADFLSAPDCCRYTSAIVAGFESSFPPYAVQPDASDALIRALSDEVDDSVTFISIGPMRNLSRFVTQERTRSLFLAKVNRVVCMAGRFDREDTAEWNVEMDIDGARAVVDAWPKEMIFCPFEAYSGVLTGRSLSHYPASPVAMAYRLHTEGSYLRPSWDLGTVIRAIEGTVSVYEDSAPGTVTIDAGGVTKFTACSYGKHRYVKLRASESEAAAYIEEMLMKAIILSEGEEEKHMFIKTRQREVFYGGRVTDGINMPYKPGFSADLSDPQGNQVLYALMSNYGKVIYSDCPFAFTIEDDGVKVEGTAGIFTHDAGSTLREAVKWTQTNVYGKKGAIPPEDMFVKPQFNTWIELIYDQNQNDIIRYAESICENGYPHSVLMIDDNWQEDYGVWRFHEGRFPDPKAMMDRLHELGFKVMLWVVPFVSPDCATFRMLAEKGVFVKTAKGRPYIAEWWNGYSALLDLSNPQAVDWFKGELKKLQDEYGVDGFKFDAGAPFYYPEDCVYHDQSMSGMKQTQLFCTLASQFEYNELRETVNQPELACVERLCDKAHSWDNNGLNTLTPNSVAQSLMGYNAICPDMIGGGSFAVFVDGNPNMDRELVVRMAQNSALLPMMQFSLAPWRVLSEQMNGICLSAAVLHERYGKYLFEAVKRARAEGEAVLRPLEYNYPHEGYEHITDEFMVEDRLLVCPVVTKGALSRKVVLPDGKWLADDGKTYEKGEYTLDAPLTRLIYFEKI